MKSPLSTDQVLPSLVSNIWPAVVGAVGSMLSSAWGASSANWNSVYQQRLAQQYAKENAGQQHRYNLEYLAKQLANSKELMDLENAYQTPAMQVARLLEAGGNPAALFGLGNGQSASAHATLPSTPSAGIPSGGIGHGVAPDLSGVGSTFLAGLSAEADVDLKAALADKTRKETSSILPVMRNMYTAMTKNYDKQSGLADAQRIYQNTINSIAERSSDDQVEGYRLRNDLTLSQIDQTIANTQKTFLESDDLRWKIERMNPMEYEQAKQDLRYTIEATALARAQKALTDKNVEYTDQGLQNLITEQVGMTLDNMTRRLDYEYDERTLDTRVKMAETQQRLAQREYKWMPWKNMASITTGVANTAVDVYSKGASGRLRNAARRRMQRY